MTFHDKLMLEVFMSFCLKNGLDQSGLIPLALLIQKLFDLPP